MKGTTMTTDNDTFEQDFDVDFSAPKPVPAQSAPGFLPYVEGVLISAPGAYRDVPADAYHDRELCDAPSISGTGLKILGGEKGQRTKGQTPRHFFERSTLNPNRKKPKETDALRLGRAFHDALLLPSAFATDYHFLPEGFSRSATKKFAAEIEDADAAIEDGLSVLKTTEVAWLHAMVAALRADELIRPLMDEGEAEVTLTWKDKETGVWLRARPDWIRPTLDVGINFKTDADASFAGFSKSIGKFGYAQGAALEMDGCEAVFGEIPRTYLHPVIEKPTLTDFEDGDFIATALWELPPEDIERGRWLNRQAIRLFADCLSSGTWPSYTPQAEPCGLPGYSRHVIDQGGAGEMPDDQIKVGG